MSRVFVYNYLHLFTLVKVKLLHVLVIYVASEKSLFKFSGEPFISDCHLLPRLSFFFVLSRTVVLFGSVSEGFLMVAAL
jgi:hypothetical protein